MTSDEQVLYDDGHAVIVSNSLFKAGNVSYNIPGILHATIRRIDPHRVLSFIIIMAGLAAFSAGAIRYFDAVSIETVYSGLLDLNSALCIGGAAVMLFGILLLIFRHRHWAVSIATPEGNIEPVKSHERDYIKEIVAAINKAIQMNHQHILL